MAAIVTGRSMIAAVTDRPTTAVIIAIAIHREIATVAHDGCK